LRTGFSISESPIQKRADTKLASGTARTGWT
jgi:hypothetical protein